MQHLSHTVPEGFVSSLKTSVDVKTGGKVLRVASGKPHAPPLIAGPVNSFDFNLAASRTPRAVYLTRWLGSHASGHNLQVDIVYGVDYRVSNPVAPHAFAPERQSLSRGRLRHRYSSDLYAFHRYTRNSAPLYKTQACTSSNAVQVPGRGVSHPTRQTACVLAPSNSD